MVVDAASCYTIVRQDVVKYWTIGVTGTMFILETVGDDSMSVLGIQEADELVTLGRHVFI